MTALRALRLDRMTEPCGSLWIELNGIEAALRCSGALWLPDEGALIAADLHLEKGSAYAMRGQLLPPYDTADTLGRLEAEVAALTPRTLILLGDSFHDVHAIGRLAPEDARRIAALAQGRALVWAEGNHDATLLGETATTLPGEIADEVRIAGLILRHEPTPGPAPGEVAGHLHPCAKIVRAGASVRRRAFLTDGSRLILPAFGAYAGGLNVRDPAFASLFARPPLAAALGQQRVYPLLWESLSGGA
ncbi:MAG: ligase-associated DNA damage response endonuclease PdeM [Caulobacteraceae bacterium]